MDPLGKVPCLQVCCYKQTVTSLDSLHTAGLARPSAEKAAPEGKPRCASEMSSALSLQSYSTVRVQKSASAQNM